MAAEGTGSQLPHARLLFLLLLAPAALWLLGLIVLPHLELGILSLRVRVAPRVYEASLAQYQTFIEEPLYWHTFVRTAVVSIIVTALTLLMAFPLAWTIAKIARGRMRATMFVLCLIPFWVSETVRALGWMILLRESGVLPGLMVSLGLTPAPVELLYHDATIVVGRVYTSMLFMVVPLISALESLDDALIEAAYDLGGNGWSILRQIIIPHAAPGIVAGCLLVFIPAVGEFVIPSLLGRADQLMVGRILSDEFFANRDWPVASAVAIVMLLALLVPIMMFQRYQRRELEAAKR